MNRFIAVVAVVVALLLGAVLVELRRIDDSLMALSAPVRLVLPGYAQIATPEGRARFSAELDAAIKADRAKTDAEFDKLLTRHARVAGSPDTSPRTSQTSDPRPSK